MNLIELERSLRQLRLGGMAAVLETRLRQAQAEPMAPIDLISCLVSDELTRRADRLLERRRKQASFRDPDRTLDNFDFSFNPKINHSLVFDLATGAFINKREDALLSALVAPARAISPKPSDRPPSCRATRFFIAKRTSCSPSSPTLLQMARARNTPNRSPPSRC
jgi:IstB-like ATP binding protein